MTLHEPTERLARSRLIVAWFDHKDTYRPGRVHQAPRCVITPQANGSQSTAPIDDELPNSRPDAALFTVTTRARKHRPFQQRTLPTAAAGAAHFKTDTGVSDLDNDIGEAYAHPAENSLLSKRVVTADVSVPVTADEIIS